MYKEIRVNKNDKGIDVSNKKNILITGLNGVGKSMLLKSMEDELLTGKITLFNKIQYEGSAKFTYNSPNGRLEVLQGGVMDLSKIVATGSLINNNHWVNAQEFLMSQNKSNLKIMNMNTLIEKDISTSFTSIEKRMISLYNKMQNITSAEIIKNNGTYSENDIEKYGYVRAKRNLDAFLEGKSVGGVNSEGNKLMIIDRDGVEKWIGDALSSGEQILFSIASLLLETDNDNKVLFWDEPERGFSPSWQRKLVPFINAIAPKAQLIATTHSTHIISVNHKKIDTEIIKLNRDKAGLHIESTDVFDDEDLFKEHIINREVLESIMANNKPVVLVEGITDKIILSDALGENYQVIDCNGHTGVKHASEILPFINKVIKIIAITDNDVPHIKGDNIKLFGTNLLGLKNKQTIEKFFSDMLTDEFKIEYSDELFLKTKNGNVELKESIYKSAIENIGFLTNDKYGSKNRKITSKVEFAKWIITQPTYKEKMSEILSYISSC